MLTRSDLNEMSKQMTRQVLEEINMVNFCTVAFYNNLVDAKFPEDLIKDLVLTYFNSIAIRLAENETSV